MFPHPPDVALLGRESRCFVCGALLNAIGTGDKSQAAGTPEPGSIIVCIRCGAICILGDDHQPRPFTDDEAADILSDPDAMDTLASMVERVHLIRHSRN